MALRDIFFRRIFEKPAAKFGAGGRGGGTKGRGGGDGGGGGGLTACQKGGVGGSGGGGGGGSGCSKESMADEEEDACTIVFNNLVRPSFDAPAADLPPGKTAKVQRAFFPLGLGGSTGT